jgi:hypothetical protein
MDLPIEGHEFRLSNRRDKHTLSALNSCRGNGSTTCSAVRVQISTCLAADHQLDQRATTPSHLHNTITVNLLIGLRRFASNFRFRPLGTPHCVGHSETTMTIHQAYPFGKSSRVGVLCKHPPQHVSRHMYCHSDPSPAVSECHHERLVFSPHDLMQVLATPYARAISQLGKVTEGLSLAPKTSIV